MAARPPPAPPARALLLALAGALLAPRAARGLTVGRTVAPAVPAGTEDGAGAYEVVSASLLDGDFRNPRRSAHGENHPEVLTFRIQLESEELIVNLERNEGLIASGFTETHYLQDGTEVSLARNHTGHCYYHGHVHGRPGSAASLSTCSGLRGLITFENKSYVLEPMDNVTDRYKLFEAEALKGVWGSCGSHPGASGPTAGGGHPPPTRTRWESPGQPGMPVSLVGPPSFDPRPQGGCEAAVALSVMNKEESCMYLWRRFALSILLNPCRPRGDLRPDG